MSVGRAQDTRENGLTLEPAALCAAFPFHVGVSPDGEILQLGDAWARLDPKLGAGAAFDDHFVFLRPVLARFEAEALVNRPLLIESRARPVRLRAQAVPSHGVIFLLATPRVHSLGELRHMGLGLADFPPHDCVPDHLYAMQGQETSLAEARRFAKQLADQKRELRAVNERLLGEMEAVRRGRDERVQLEHRVKEAERLESLGVLAGGVAHDFNNLLVPIVAGAEMLRADVADEQAQRTADEILQAAGLATELCQQMLSYAGRTPVRLEPVALDALIDGMRELVRATTHGMILRFELAPTPRGLRADPTQVRQVLLNLVLNASEACGAEGGCLVLRTGIQQPGESAADAAVIGELDATAPYAYLEVEDDGPGMEPDILERVFDPFFSTKLLGRGLGMAVVFGIVRRHEGAVRVTSELGRGTTIRVLFPIAAEETEAREPAPLPEVVPAERGRVLLVDDDPRVRTTAQRMLERKGFQVAAVGDGKEALDLCREIGHELSCVLLDLSMPGMSGEQVYRALREKLPFLPIVLMSGYTGERVAELLRGDPRALFLHKPFGSEALLGAIGRASAKVECTAS